MRAGLCIPCAQAWLVSNGEVTADIASTGFFLELSRRVDMVD